MKTVEIGEDRIRQFAQAGGLSDQATDEFLNSQCYVMQMRNIDAAVVAEVLSHIMEVGLVVGCQASRDLPGTMNLGFWVPFHAAQRILTHIRELYRANGLECPHEFMDFQNMDSAMVGRDYIRAMLEGYVRKYGDLP